MSRGRWWSRVENGGAAKTTVTPHGRGRRRMEDDGGAARTMETPRDGDEHRRGWRRTDDSDAAQMMATPRGRWQRRINDGGNGYDFLLISFNHCIDCSVWIWTNAMQSLCLASMNELSHEESAHKRKLRNSHHCGNFTSQIWGSTSTNFYVKND